MNPALSISIAFTASLFVTNFASRFKYLPKVTIYILVGVIMGPSLLHFIPEKLISNLYVIKELALGILLFTVGQEFTIQKIKKIERNVLGISFFEILFTFLLVGGGIYLFTKNFAFAAIAGIIATATAPASTLIVIINQSSEGKLSTYIKGMILINNLFALIIFILAFPFVYYIGFGSPSGGLLNSFYLSLWEIFGSIIIGVLIGFLLSLWEMKEHKDANKVLLGFTGVILAIGLTKLLNLVDMIVFLVVGITYANSSVGQSELKNLVKKIELPFYVLFFILSGAALHVKEIYHAGILGIAYIILRGIGKYFGIKFGCWRKKQNKSFSNQLSLSMFSHSAIAIGITAFLITSTGTKFSPLITFVLASIAFFEIIGPVLVKIMIIKSGESTIANVMKSRGHKAISSIKYVLKEIFISLGILKEKQKNISNSIIRDTSAIHETANYKKVLKFIEHSHYDVFPVVNNDGYFVGAISYFDIQDIAFDPYLTDIITAVDLMTSELYVNIDESIDKVIKCFKETNNAYLPAVHFSENKMHLIGLLSQRDVLSIQVKDK